MYRIFNLCKKSTYLLISTLECNQYSKWSRKSQKVSKHCNLSNYLHFSVSRELSLNLCFTLISFVLGRENILGVYAVSFWFWHMEVLLKHIFIWLYKCEPNLFICIFKYINRVAAILIFKYSCYTWLNMFGTVTILLSERRKYVKCDPIFFKRRENTLKLFELLNKVTQLWSYAIRCLSFWKKVQVSWRTMGWKAAGKQVKNPQSILLSLALNQSPFLIIFLPLKGAAVGGKCVIGLGVRNEL